MSVKGGGACGRGDKIIELLLELLDEIDELGFLKQGKVFIPDRCWKLGARDCGYQVERANVGLIG